MAVGIGKKAGRDLALRPRTLRLTLREIAAVRKADGRMPPSSFDRTVPPKPNRAKTSGQSRALVDGCFERSETYFVPEAAT